VITESGFQRRVITSQSALEMESLSLCSFGSQSHNIDSIKMKNITNQQL
jgi:hypothetical protein